MSIEVRPVGVTCNLRCSYCYEQPMRDCQPVHRYNKEAVLAQLHHVQGQWSLFGGEALLIPLPDLEELLQIGFDRWKSTGIQTNGTLITDKHLDLFAKYKTNVGISLDGPDELNDSRWAGNLEATRKMTDRTFWALDALLERSKLPGCGHLIPSLIITLHAGNASKDRWPKMRAWLLEMDQRGIRNLNVHLMELDHEAGDLYLPHEEIKAVMLDLWDLSTQFSSIKIVNFKEIVDLLRGQSNNAMCTWHSCDPWNTSAVQGLEGDGSPSHCSRTNKDGKDWLPAEGDGVASPWQVGTFTEGKRYHERQLSLYVTPQEHGGCQDCRFWLMCQGQCPGSGKASVEGRHGDWRLRSSYCQSWKDMFEEGERRLKAVAEVPVSLHVNRKKYEEYMYAQWVGGREIGMSGAIYAVDSPNSPPPNQPGNRPHGDHYDSAGTGAAPHRDVLTANRPHGDHTDESLRKFDRPHGDHNDESLRNTARPHGDHTDESLRKFDRPHGDHTDRR